MLLVYTVLDSMVWYGMVWYYWMYVTCVYSTGLYGMVLLPLVDANIVWGIREFSPYGDGKGIPPFCPRG